MRIVCAADKRLLLAETRGMLCDAPDGRGISVLCSGVAGVEEVRRLLDEGYPRYEAVVVLDSVRRPEAFAAVLAEFHLIDVNYDPADDLPAEGVRGLYRSRKRCYRRLVVVDKAFTSCRADFDAAVGVAIYDYVLPLRPGIRMMPFCIGRLAIELSLEPAGAVELVRSPVGEPLLLVAREAAVAAGGFGRIWCGAFRGAAGGRSTNLSAGCEALGAETGPASRCGPAACGVHRRDGRGRVVGGVRRAAHAGCRGRRRGIRPHLCARRTHGTGRFAQIGVNNFIFVNYSCYLYPRKTDDGL